MSLLLLRHACVSLVVSESKWALVSLLACYIYYPNIKNCTKNIYFQYDLEIFSY
jgi:hypothetical protein